jgi:hypothetical protein
MRLTACASRLPKLSRVKQSRVKMPIYGFIRARTFLPDRKPEAGSRKPL